MKRVAFYVRVSTADGQSTENQTRALHEVAARSGWNVTAIFSDDGISGSKGRDRRPGLDAMLKAVTRREVDLVAAWSVDRLGRSLPDLVGLLGELQGRGVDLFLHQQALDASTPSGRMMFQMLGVFAEFERSLIRSRVMAGLERTRAKGTRLGRPPLDPDKAEAIQGLLASGVGIRETARRTGVGASTVQRVRAAMIAPRIRRRSPPRLGRQGSRPCLGNAVTARGRTVPGIDRTGPQRCLQNVSGPRPS